MDKTGGKVSVHRERAELLTFACLYYISFPFGVLEKEMGIDCVGS